MIDPDWKTRPITREQWEAECRASYHVRPGDRLAFTEAAGGYGNIVCYIEGTSVFLGSWFPQATVGVPLAGTGWCHK